MTTVNITPDDYFHWPDRTRQAHQLLAKLPLTDTLTYEDLDQLAAALGFEVHITFMPTGRRIGDDRVIPTVVAT